METIGIKLADGSFYPLLEEGKPAKKSVSLTTVQDNQTIVHVDVYRSKTGTMEDAEYVDTLEIKNLNPHANGEPSFNLDIGLDENNELSADISDPETGKSSETKVELISRTLSETKNPPVHFEKDPTISQEPVTDGVVLDDDLDFQQNNEAKEMLGNDANSEDFSFDSLMDDSQKNENSENQENEQTVNEENITDNFDLAEFDEIENSVNPEEILLDQENNVEDINAKVQDLPQEDSDSPDSPDLSDSSDSQDSAEEKNQNATSEFIASPVGIKASKGHKHSAEKKVPSVEEVLAENTSEENLQEDQEGQQASENADFTEDDFSNPEDFNEETKISESTEQIENPSNENSEEEKVPSVEDILAGSGNKNEEDFTLPDFDDSQNEGTEDFSSENISDVALPDFDDFNENEENSVDEENSLNEENNQDKTLAKDAPAEEEEDFNLDLPDFVETSENSATQDFSADEVPEEDLDSLTKDFSTEGLDGDDEEAKSNYYSAVGLGSAFDDDIGEPDLSSTEEDEKLTKDPTFEPNNEMFSDLYDKETLEGKNSYSEEDVEKKTKVPVIICIICAVICILASLFVLFVIPSKFNLLKKNAAKPEEKLQNQTEEISQPAEENLESENSSEDENEILIEISSDEEDLGENAENSLEETEIAETAEQNAAKEDEIVVAQSPENIVPVEPEPSPVKIEDIRYKIKWGDTLWDISNAYYKNPWRYKYLARYNGIKNPDHIISGNWILIPAE